MDIEARLAALGLTLPPPVVIPSHVRLPFAFVRVSGNRAYISGHAPLDSARCYGSTDANAASSKNAA